MQFVAMVLDVFIFCQLSEMLVFADGTYRRF